MVDILLKNGANVNAIDEKKNSPLHLVGQVEDPSKQYAIAMTILNAGADINLKNEYDEKPEDVISNVTGECFFLVIIQKNLMSKNVLGFPSLSTVVRILKGRGEGRSRM